MNQIKVTRLLLKCYAEKRHDQQWVACCIDLCLAAQADSFKEARIKLESMIKEYIYDALVGQDKKHAYQLLTRKAPIHEKIKYYFYSFLAKFENPETSTHRSFNEIMPLEPSHC